MEVVELEGVFFEIDDCLPEEGELYIAERNIGKQLLKAKVVDQKNRWIIPFENAYVYDFHECKKVIKIVE